MAQEARPFGDDLWEVACCSSGVRPQGGGGGAAGVDRRVLVLKGATPDVHQLHSYDTFALCPNTSAAAPALGHMRPLVWPCLKESKRYLWPGQSLSS